MEYNRVKDEQEETSMSRAFERAVRKNKITNLIIICIVLIILFSVVALLAQYI